MQTINQLIDKIRDAYQHTSSLVASSDTLARGLRTMAGSKPIHSPVLITPEIYANKVMPQNQTSVTTSLSPDDIDDIDDFDFGSEETSSFGDSHNSECESESILNNMKVTFNGQHSTSRQPVKPHAHQAESKRTATQSLSMIELWIKTLHCGPDSKLKALGPLLGEIETMIRPHLPRRKTMLKRLYDDLYEELDEFGEVMPYDGEDFFTGEEDSYNEENSFNEEGFTTYDEDEEEIDSEEDQETPAKQTVNVSEKSNGYTTTDGMFVPMGVTFINGKWVSNGSADDTVDDLDAIDDFDFASTGPSTSTHNTPSKTKTQPTHDFDEFDDDLDDMDINVAVVSPVKDKKNVNLMTLNKKDMEALTLAVDGLGVETGTKLGLIRGTQTGHTGDMAIATSTTLGEDFPDTIDDLEEDFGEDEMEKTDTTEANDTVDSIIPKFKTRSKSSRKEAYPDNLDNLDEDSHDDHVNSADGFVSRSGSHTPSSTSTSTATMPTTPDSSTRSSLTFDAFDLDDLDGFEDNDVDALNTKIHTTTDQSTALSEGAQKELHEFDLPESLQAAFRLTEKMHNETFNAKAFTEPIEKVVKSSIPLNPAMVQYPALCSLAYVHEQNMTYQWTKYLANLFEKQPTV